jgi:hypothetical protein
MANRDMLTEAIADAKALKETAIANAKAALEEAFTPRMKEMLSAKLQELDEEEHDEVDKMDEAKKKYRDDDRKDGGESKETKRTEKMKYGKDLAESEDIDEETDLDEILAELENDLSEDARTDAEEEGYEDGMEDEKEDEEDKEEDEDIDLEEMSEDDLKSFIEDVIKDMVESGELEAGDEFEGEDEESENEEIEIEDEDETEEIMESKEEVNELYDLMMNPSDMEILIGMLSGLVGFPAATLAATYAKDGLEAVKRLVKGKKAGMEEADELDERQKYGGNKGDESRSSGAYAKEKEGHGRGPLKKDSAEAEGRTDYRKRMEEELNELRSELHEVNLLNAKLLYTNKIFRAKNLMETQKVKVLEAFDKATTVKEVKLVYETLNEGIKEKAPIRENLGSASKPAGVAPKQQIVEVDSQFARWQKLAGIIK